MKSTRDHQWKKKRMFKNNVRLFKFDFAERADNELFNKILNFFIDSALNNDWKNEIQKTEQNDDVILNFAQFYYTTQSHTTHSFSVNVLLNLKNMNIISENENSEQFEKITTNKKTQIENENEIESEKKIENENDNENFEKIFTVSKFDKNKNKTKKINFETKNEQFAAAIIHESETKQTDSFTIKSIKKIILKNLNVKQKKIFRMQTKLEIQTEIEKKFASSKKKQLINISMKNDIIQIEQIIKLLHFYAKFMIANDADVIDFTSFSMSFSVFAIDKKIVKIFVKLIKNSKLNRIFKKSEKYKMFAKKICYLRIHDKKKRLISAKISKYEFIDAFEVNMKKKNIWFSYEFANKLSRNQTILRMTNDHKKKKIKIWKNYLINAHIFWCDKMMWKWILMQQTRKVYEVIFFTDMSMNQLMTFMNSNQMKYSDNFHEKMHNL